MPLINCTNKLRQSIMQLGQAYTSSSGKSLRMFRCRCNLAVLVWPIETCTTDTTANPGLRRFWSCQTAGQISQSREGLQPFLSTNSADPRGLGGNYVPPSLAAGTSPPASGQDLGDNHQQPDYQGITQLDREPRQSGSVPLAFLSAIDPGSPDLW